MPLSTNGAARTLHEDQEARLLRAAQGQGFAQQQESLATEFPYSGHFVGIPAILSTAAVQLPQTQPRPLLHGLLEGLVKTCQRWRLAKRQQAVLLGCSDTASAEELLSGRYLSLSQDVKDRIGYVVGISVGLGMLFNESIDAELDWLNRPHPKLHNQSPLAHILQGRMAQLIAVSALVDEERALR
jgi:hypothetical protein